MESECPHCKSILQNEIYNKYVDRPFFYWLILCPFCGKPIKILPCKYVKFFVYKHHIKNKKDSEVIEYEIP